MITMGRSISGTAVTVSLDLYDKMTNADYPPLFTFTSQASGDSLTTLPLATDYENKDRYVSCGFITGSNFVPSLGFITFGTTDLPYGFYDATIYQNSGSSNLDPTGLTIIWEGLANFYAIETGILKNPAVEYTDYDNNDADTESVYITFEK
tara:strand:+ start:1059 stop:1511 length:453 start_codon:yes stop_codon:yes gene_type:complete